MRSTAARINLHENSLKCFKAMLLTDRLIDQKKCLPLTYEWWANWWLSEILRQSPYCTGVLLGLSWLLLDGHSARSLLTHTHSMLGLEYAEELYYEKAISFACPEWRHLIAREFTARGPLSKSGSHSNWRATLVAGHHFMRGSYPSWSWSNFYCILSFDL